MSKLPNTWIVVEIGEIADVVGGGTPKANDEANFTAPGEGIAWLTPADLSGYKSKLITAGARDLTLQGYQSCSAKLMPKGTLLFSSRAPIGYVAVAAKEIATNQGFKSFVFYEGIDPSYAFYYLKSIRKLADSLGTGTTFKELSGATAKTLPFQLAPTAEQTRIAAKLDELLAQVDALKVRIDRIPALLKRFRQSVLAAAVSGKLTEEWRKENHAPDFQQTTIGKLFKLIDGDRGPNYPKKNDYHAHGHCLFLSTKNVRKYGFVFDEKQFISKEKHQVLRAGSLSRGDIIITTRGTLGNVASYDESVPFDVVRINSGMLILRKLEPDLKNEFFKMLIASPLFQKLIEDQRSGSAQPQLPAKIIREFNVSVPSLKEQFEIARRAEQLFAFADQLDTRVAAALMRIQHLTQSILAKAFRGELIPQDSNDESASVLLDRIKAQRATVPKAKRGRQAATLG